mgnify:CR=1 FL=1
MLATNHFVYVTNRLEGETKFTAIAYKFEPF